MNTHTVNESLDQVEKAAQSVMQACEEVGTMAREHVDATMRAATAAWEGCTEINQNMSGLIQESVARAMNAGKTIMSAKSVKEAMDLHADFVKDAFDCWVAGTGKISEISARVTKEAIDPLAEHANKTFGKIAQRAKAA